jgi:hypothetical protein
MGLSLAPDIGGYAEVDPLPEGFAEIILGLEEPGGPVRYVRLLLDPDMTVSLQDLVRRLDLVEPRHRPPIHRGDPDGWAYTKAREDGRTSTVTIALRARTLVQAVTAVL